MLSLLAFCASLLQKAHRNLRWFSPLKQLGGLLAALTIAVVVGASPAHAQPSGAFGYYVNATTSCTPATSTYITAVTCTVELNFAPGQTNFNTGQPIPVGPVTGQSSLMRFEFSNGVTLYSSLDPNTGRASVTTAASANGNEMSAGQRQVYVDFAFTHPFLAISSGQTADFTVNPATSSVTLAASKSSLGLGEMVNLIATVNTPYRTSGDAVDFYVGGVNGMQLGTANLLNNNTATLFNFTGLPGGSNSIVAVFRPNSRNVSGSTSTATTVNVTKVGSATGMASNYVNDVGTMLPFTITVSQIAGAIQSTQPTGAYRVKQGGAIVATGTVTNGTASGTIGPLSLLQYGKSGQDFVQFDVEYDGDSIYEASVGARTIFLKPVGIGAPTVTASANNIPKGSPVTITASIAGAGGLVPTGTMTFKDVSTGTVLGTPNLSGGSASITINAPMTGTIWNVSAEYSGNVDFGASAVGNTQITLIAPQAQISLATSNATPTFGTSITLTATVTGTNPTGNVTFKDGSTTLGTAALANGVATLATSALSGGAHSITASYAGDANNSGNTSSAITVTVALATTTTALQSSAGSASFGTNITFTATVSGGSSPSGTMTFKDGSTTIGTSAVSGGSASFSTTTLAVGSRSITAVYSGDANNTTSTSLARAVTITQATSTTALSASNTNPDVGSNVTFTATVTPSAATGTVTFRNGSTTIGTGTLSGGVATFSTSALAVNTTHSMTAVYAGDTNTGTSTSSALSVTVKQITTTTTLQVSNAAPVPGQSVTFTATITPPTASGTVQFSNGTQPLGSGNVVNGVATFTTTSLGIGNYSINAQYFGDTNNAPSQSAAVGVAVAKRTPSVGLTASSTSPAHGTAVTFTVTMTAAVGGLAPTGQVMLTNTTTNTSASATLSGSTATFTHTNLGPGPHSFTAQYAGDAANNVASSAGLGITVGAAPSSVSVTSSPASPTFGSPVTLTATVTGTTPSGTVTFKDGATTLGTGSVSNGVATFVTSALAVGARTITAVYGGDTKNQTSTSAVHNLTIMPAVGSIALQISNQSPSFGTSITMTATVTGSNPSGTVIFKDGATTLSTVALAAGQATLPISNLAIGVHTITAVYSGDANNAGATSSAQAVTVGKAVNALTFSVTPSNSNFGQKVDFSVQYANSTATGTITYKNGATTLGSSTLSGGTSTFSITSLAIGTHTITAEYSGDASNASAVSSAQSVTVGKAVNTLTLSGTPTNQQYGQAIAFSVQFGSNSATGTITYKNGSTTLGTSVLSNGSSTFSFNGLAIGSHSITAEYSGDTANAIAISTALAVTVTTPTVGVTLAASATNVNYNTPVTFSVTVAGFNPTGTVTFTDIGSSKVLGSATLNAGAATFTTSALAPGARIIVASYGGDNANVARNSSPVTVTVAPSVTGILLTSSSSTPVFGTPVTLTATLTGLNPTGTVVFSSSNGGILRSVLVGDGKATLSINSLALGQHVITAAYSGDGSNQPVTSTAITLNVVSTTGTFTLAASNVTPPIGDKVTFTATLRTTGVAPTGTVTFRDGTKAIGTAPLLTGGTATFISDALELGTHAITAVYSGDANYVTLTSPVLNVEVKPPTPRVSNVPINVNYGSGGTIDLSGSVSADTTCIDIVVAPKNGKATVICNNPSAATSSAMRAARIGRSAPTGSIKVQYTPNPGYTGPDSFAVVAVSPSGRSNPATVSLVIPARANPALNAEVQGIVSAQVSTVRRLGQSQIANVSSRLEQLHDEDLPPVSMGLAFSAPEERNEPRSFREATDPNFRSARQFSGMQKLNRDLDKSMGQLGNAQTPKMQGPTTFAIWTAGTISLGQLNNQGGTTSRFTSEGVTAGIDMRVMDGLRVGFAVGFGADRTKVGSLGSRSSGTNVSATLYASYRLLPQTFLDVLAGYGHVKLTSRRFDTVNSVFLQGDRSGQEFHGAVALTYEARWGKWKVAPYGRIEVLHVNLNKFTEEGLGIAALNFGSLSSTSYSSVLGLRTSYPFEMSWGTLTPMGRIEYRQTSEGGYTQALGYADVAGPAAFSIINRANGTGQLTIGLGAKAVFSIGGAFDIEHQFSTSTTTKKNFSNTTRGRYQLNF